MVNIAAIVRDADAAASALEGGADRLVFPLDAGSGAVELEAVLPGVLARIAERRPISLLFTSQADAERARAGWWERGGIDEIRVPLAELPHILKWCDGAIRLVAVVSADTPPDADVADRVLAARARGVMLVSPSNGPARLLDAIPVAALGGFSALCLDRGLTVSLSGGLEPPDIPRLLPLAPTELCFDHTNLVDPHGGAGHTRVRLLADLVHGSSTASIVPQSRLPPDQIFMKDWVLPVRIGAYEAERASPQRVRFSVQADIGRRAARVADLRDVVSYDLITDTIRRLTLDHVDLVETLAEGIATTLLRHPRIESVTVVIEKLDLGPGAMGCRIVRSKSLAETRVEA